MTLGSLFSGSGGFELAGALAGIEPVWNAEIESFPAKVTEKRFPHVVNYGDVTKINGGELPPVDIITFGSPCQDLSTAGRQAGLHEGGRSILFFEAIRIITEMLEATDGKYPRYTLFENVPGMLTSHKGDDFRDVLQAFVDIKDPMYDVPKPDKWGGSGCIMGDSYSFAWRTYDAQFWGVPQRRKRVYLLGCLSGQRAGEILFKCESERWDPETGRRAWERASSYIKGRFGEDRPAWLR